MFKEINPGNLINNRYLIQKFLGQGGFGKTYLALDTQRFGEPCVIKEFISTNSKPEIIQKSRNLFEQEARILYKIDHPQIPKFKAWFNDQERLFIVQEFIDGKTYSQILNERLAKKRQAFSEAEIRTWLSDILPVLDYIHSQHIIHRDISPENIMFGHKQGKPILIDFGVVKEKFTQFFAVNSNQQQLRGSVVGKIGYSPPEQLRMGYCYPCSDLYALGVCVIVLLTGKAPFMLINESLEWRWESYIKVSDSLNRILRKMLAEKPTQRYQSAKEIFAQLHPGRVDINTSLTTEKAKQTDNPQVNNQRKLFTSKELEEEIILQELEQKLRGEDKVINQLEVQESISISQNFIEYCQEELTSFVGPFASVLIKHTLQHTPTIRPDEFMEVLAEAIPHPQRAKEFKNRVQNSLRNNSIAPQPSANSFGSFTNQSAIFSSKFIEDCRRELTSFVGPFASIMIDDTLNEHPEFTPKELVETLSAQIPDRERAQKFKRRIEAFY